jgi:hypothetical protein
MQAIVEPLVGQLHSSLQSDASLASDVTPCLEQLCALLRGVTLPHQGWSEAELRAMGGHPCVALLESMWEVLDSVFARHGASSSCMEKLCRCYKHTARNCGEPFRAVVPKLLPQVG